MFAAFDQVNIKSFKSDGFLEGIVNLPTSCHISNTPSMEFTKMASNTIQRQIVELLYANRR